MSTTVRKLAKISGVSVRTLHFYDEIGLLKPAYQGQNGYRYYNEEQLLQLQQILFYRELGFPLADIRRVLASADFDKIEALRAHRAELERKAQQTQELIRTIDKTIARLNGGMVMTEYELFHGFDAARQEEYERELIRDFGDGARTHIEESKRRMSAWSKEDFEKVGAHGAAVLTALVALVQAGARPADAEVQAQIDLHHKWILYFWTPDAASYAGLGKMYAEHAGFRSFFEPYHPGLADFLSVAMAEYATRKLA